MKTYTKWEDSNIQNKIHGQHKASSLSSLTDNLAEECHKGKYKDCKSCLECMAVNYVLLVFSCIEKEFDEDLAKRFDTDTDSDSMTETLTNFVKHHIKMLSIPRSYMNYTVIYRFYPKE